MLAAQLSQDSPPPKVYAFATMVQQNAVARGVLGDFWEDGPPPFTQILSTLFFPALLHRKLAMFVRWQRGRVFFRNPQQKLDILSLFC